MNNNQWKKEQARLHNLTRDERLAYAQDRIQQPDKYKDIKRNRKAQLSWALVLASMNKGFK